MLYVVISMTRYLNAHSSRAASLAAEEFIHFLLWASCIAPISGPLQYQGSPCQHFQRSLEEDSTFCLYIWSPNHPSHYKMETRFFGGPFCHLYLSNEIPDAKEPDQIWDTHLSSLQKFWITVLCWDPKPSREAQGKKYLPKELWDVFLFVLARVCAGPWLWPALATHPLLRPLFTSSIRALASP